MAAHLGAFTHDLTPVGKHPRAQQYRRTVCTLGPCIVRRVCGRSSVAGDTGSFLNRVPPRLRVVDMGWGRPRLLPPDPQGCLLPHVGQDVHLDVADRGPVVPAHDGFTVRPHQELLKVPADVMDLHGFPEEAARRAQELRGGRAGVLGQG